jgi:hypothetical protein
MSSVKIGERSSRLNAAEKEPWNRSILQKTRCLRKPGNRRTKYLSTSVDGFAVTLEERDMMIRLSDQEVSVLLGATLMHWGVPFRRATRCQLTEHQQASIDAASDKLIALREMHQRNRSQEASELFLSEEEAALLIAVIEDCLNQCGSDPTELRLQLKTSDPKDVESLLARIRTSLGPEFVRLS